MQTIAITLDDEVLQAVDTMTKSLHITRSTFTQHALQLALQRSCLNELEEKHRQGYLKKPVFNGEFSDWEDEQAWGD